MPRIDDDDLKSVGSESAVKKAEPIVKKKIRNFSEKYDRGKQIGTGPFGHVYLCQIRDDQIANMEVDDAGTTDETGKKRTLTLKILKKNLLSQKPALDDLLVNEFKVLMDARHPNIIRMFDIFQDRQNFFVVQEYLQGEDLYSVLNRGVFTEEQAI